jgi:hypothetical protein
VVPVGVLALLQAASGTLTAMSNAAAMHARAVIFGSHQTDRIYQK